jgi:hypothetical protein
VSRRRRPTAGQLVEALVAATLLCGLVGVVRQRRESQAIRRGELAPASAAADLTPARPEGRVAQRLAGWVPPPPRTPVGRIAGGLAAAPLSAVGLAIAAAAGRRPRWDAELGCLVVRGMRGPSAMALRAVGASANTLGHVVLARQDEPSRLLLAHEAVHVRQAERLGPLLVPLYAWCWARYGYRDHPLERAARAGARTASGGRVA